MNCQDTQNILLEDPAAETSTVQEHLATCASCRRFADFQRRLLAAPLASPSPALDQAILQGAAFRLARQRRRQRQRWLAAAAAVLLLAGWLAAIAIPRPDPAQQIASASTTASVWADGKLDAALKTIETEAQLLSQPTRTDGGSREHEIPTFKELDNQLFDFELHFYFERAVLGTIEERANG